MREYENLIIFAPKLDDISIDKKLDDLKAIIENGGEFLNLNKWGIKKLAYPKAKKDKGYYVLLEFKSSPEILPKLTSKLNLDSSVMGHSIIRKGS